MKANWFTHIPAVKLHELEDFNLHLGSLSYLDFDTWYDLDGTFRYKQDNYEKSKPLFFVGELEFDSDSKINLIEVMKSININFYWALLLGTGGALIPNPQMSCSYYQIESKIGVYNEKHIGSFEREWIVFGDYYRIPLHRSVLENVDIIFNFLQKSKDISNMYIIMQGLRTLQFTSNPEYWLQNLKNDFNYFYGFVPCMSVLESILVPESVKKNYNMSITESFGKNAAAFTMEHFADIDEFAPYYSNMYRIRSKIIHGEAHNEKYTPKVEECFQINRSLLTMVIKNLIALNNFEFDLNSLPALLVNACKDKSSHEHLHKLINKGCFNE